MESRVNAILLLQCVQFRVKRLFLLSASLQQAVVEAESDAFLKFKTDKLVAVESLGRMNVIHGPYSFHSCVAEFYMGCSISLARQSINVLIDSNHFWHEVW